LEELFKLRAKADDILIIRNNLVTDSYYCNVAFWDGSSWLTPNDPLLRGTQRARCIELGLIKEQEITKEDIYTFEKICLFNAMIPFEEKIEIDIKNILT
jgi:4-amino-4-deoxychorismate lyase